MSISAHLSRFEEPALAPEGRITDFPLDLESTGTSAVESSSSSFCEDGDTALQEISQKFSDTAHVENATGKYTHPIPPSGNSTSTGWAAFACPLTLLLSFALFLDSLLSTGAAARLAGAMARGCEHKTTWGSSSEAGERQWDAGTNDRSQRKTGLRAKGRKGVLKGFINH